MNKQLISLSIFLMLMLASLMLSGCTEEETTQPPLGPPNTGTANFARYVALGNSLTAGFQSNALSQRDQPYSYPNLIAGQVQVSFEQPLIKDPGIGSRIRLLNLAPTLVNETGVDPTSPSSNLNVMLARPYNNLGIPGAIVFDMADTSEFLSKSVQRGNPFFAQILRTGALGKSIVAQAKNLQPTFISVWIGNNDVLGYATSGGTRGTNAGLVDPPRTKPTEPPVFASLYRAMMDELKATGAGIVTANIPDVTTVPFFTTIGPQIGAKIPAGLTLRYQRNGNTSVAFDTTTLRGASTDPLITLSGSTYASLLGRPTGKWYLDNGITTIPPGIDTTKPFGFHPQNPWPDALTLDTGEQAIAQAAVDAFNAIIDSVATNRGVGYVNVNLILKTIKTQGMYIPELGTFSSDFIKGGLFSYDGVHPSSRGQAIIANEFIKVINTKFSAQIPLINPTSIPGIPIGKVSTEAATQNSWKVWNNLIDMMNGGSAE